jgi:hypothetical protein
MSKYEAPDWLGCGRTITQQSWDAFMKAQNDYYETHCDALCISLTHGHANCGCSCHRPKYVTERQTEGKSNLGNRSIRS